MKIDFTDEQLELLKDVLEEYAEACYQDMLAYKKVAVDGQEEFLVREYNALADAEEEHFNRVKGLHEYVVKYEALMRNV